MGFTRDLLDLLEIYGIYLRFIGFTCDLWDEINISTMKIDGTGRCDSFPSIQNGPFSGDMRSFSGG